MINSLKAVLWRIWFPATLILLWQLTLHNSSNLFFPPPSKILESARFVASSDWVAASIRSSFTVLFSGYVIGALCGVVLGALIGGNETLREIFTPITNFIRSIPSVAKVPVIMAILGIGTATRITAIAIAVLFPVLMATMRSVASTDQSLLELSQLLGYGRIRALFAIRIPAATGDILTGLHASVQVALLVMVVSEMLGSGVGMGAFVVRSQNSFMISDMWVGVIAIGLLGVALNWIFVVAERRITPWYFASRTGS